LCDVGYDGLMSDRNFIISEGHLRNILAILGKLPHEQVDIPILILQQLHLQTPTVTDTAVDPDWDDDL